ncbi:hypothetical protein Tco_1306031 [Tanacetum coccineum]
MSEAEPIPPASSVTTLLDDWSIEINADHVDLGQDGLGVFDWSEEADNAPIALALMATSSTDSSNSKVPYCSKCSKSYKKLLENYQTERDNFQRARSEILGYQMSLESLEVMLKTHEKNEYAWGDKYEQMEYDLKIRDLKLEEKQKELDQVLKERDDFKVKLEKWTNASVLQNEVLNKQRYLSDKSCIGFGVESSSGMESDNSSGDETLTDHLYENFKREKAYKAVPPPTGTIIPPRANVSFTGIDELAIRNKVNNQEKIKSSQPEIDRNKVIIEDWVDSDDEETVLNSSETQKKTVLNSENSETSFKNRSPSSQNSVGQGSRKKGLGNNGGKLCFRRTNDEEVARKIQAEWDAEEERKRFEELKKTKPKTTLRKPTSLAQERNQMMSFLKGQGYKNLQKLKYPQMKELYDKVQASIKDSFKDFVPMDSEKEREMLKERDVQRLSRKRKATITEAQPSKKPKLRSETIDELRNYLRVVDFEKNAQDKESLEGISMITELQVIDSPDGEYLIIHRANNHFRAFDTLWEILHVLDRQDLYHLYRVVDDYYEHIPPTGLGLSLLGDLNIIWETAESSDDDFWKDQEEWEIIRWRFHESSGVHTLEIEDGTMIHMLAERRYPLSRELMIRMLEHGMEVENESETAITLIHLFILWTTEDGDNS